MQITKSEASTILMCISTHEMEADKSETTEALRQKIYKAFPPLLKAQQRQDQWEEFWGNTVEQDPRVQSIRSQINQVNVLTDMLRNQPKNYEAGRKKLDELFDELYSTKKKVAEELSPNEAKHLISSSPINQDLDLDETMKV